RIAESTAEASRGGSANVIDPRAAARARNRVKEARSFEVADLHPLTLPGAALAEVRSFLVAGKLPLLPDVAMQLLDSANRPNVAIEPLARKIERDNTIAGRLLSVANSALHLRSTPATSVRAAVVRLGLGETRDVIFQLVMSSPALKLPVFAVVEKELKQHALIAAYVCRETCRLLRQDADLAFLCGLLHDVGKTILLLCASKYAGSKEPPSLDD